jgi:hypothetical protein
MATTTLTNTSISETYVSLLHSNGEILPAVDQEWIYDGCGNRSSLKLGRACNGATICGTLSCDTLVSGNYDDFLSKLHPVNSVLFTTDNVNPGTRLAGTTWIRISQGSFIAGVGTGTDKNSSTHTVAAGLDSSTGEYTHQLTENEMPSHSHQLDSRLFSFVSFYNAEQGGVPDGRGSRDITTTSTGGNQPHNNIPPYFGLYVWQRTA